MKKGKLLNATLVTAALAMLAVFALSVRLHAAADTVALLQAQGMTCGSCATAITRLLEKEKGVEGVKVDLEQGLVAVGYEAKKVQPERLARCVADAGYGCSVAGVVSAEEYRRTMGAVPAAQGRSCGCCDKKQEQGRSK
jgi:periplasmic mercuric ion binding protein